MSYKLPTLYTITCIVQAVLSSLIELEVKVLFWNKKIQSPPLHFFHFLHVWLPGQPLVAMWSVKELNNEQNMNIFNIFRNIECS